jgi:hypothetical protein
MRTKTVILFIKGPPEGKFIWIGLSDDEQISQSFYKTLTMKFDE